MVADTVEDVKQLPAAPAAAASFPAKRILLPLCLAQFMNSYDTSAMNVAIGDIVADLDTTVTAVQTTLSLYTLVMAAGMITGSKLADIWGRKRTFLIGVITFGTGAFISALSPNIAVMMFSFSVLEGIGSVLMIPPIYILVTVNFTDLKSRAAAFGAVTAMAGLGSASGPLIGGVITTAVSWRLSFASEVLLVIIIVLLHRRIVDASARGAKPKLDIGGAVLSAIGMAALVIGPLLAGTYGWITARKDFTIAGQTLISEGSISPVWIFIGLGLVVLVVFGVYSVYRERHGKEPLVHSRILNRVATFGLITQSAQWFLTLSIFFVVSVFLQVTFEFNAIETGLMLMPAILGILFFSRRAGKIASRYSHRAIIQAGFLVVTAGVVALLLMVDPDGSAWRFIPGLFLVGSGIGLIMPASVDLVQSSASETDQGEISGVSRSASNFGSALGTAIAGAVLVSALITGVTQRTEDSTVLPPEAKTQISAALEEEVSAMSDTQIRQILEGQPPAVVDEVVRINGDSRDRALGLALLTVGIIGLVGLVATFFLPGRKPSPQVEEAAQPGPAASERGVGEV
jgi:MFS family permease